MPAKEPENEPKEHLTDLQMLDRLIQEAYEKLQNSIGEDPKLGDFLKMIETRHKLAPQRSAQNEFWKMINRIREEHVSKNGASSQSSSSPATVKPRKRSTVSKGTKS